MVQLFVCENKMDCLDLQKYNKNMNFQKYNVLFVGNCQKYFEDVFMIRKIVVEIETEF